MWEWEQDPEFASLSREEKRKVRSNFFDENMTDTEFWTLPKERQEQIRNRYLSQFETEGPRHGRLGRLMGEPEPQPEATLGRIAGAIPEGIKDVVRETLEFPVAAREVEQEHPFVGRVLKTIPGFGSVARGVSETGKILKDTGLWERVKPALEPSPEYDEQSSGFWEDVARTAPQFGVAMLTGGVGGGLLRREAIKAAEKAGRTLGAEEAAKIFAQGAKMTAGTQMFAQIAGGTYADLVDEGVDKDRAFIASIMNASLQTPLETLGLEKVLNAWKPGRPIYKKVLDFLVGMGTEGLEEFVQQYPDEFSRIWARQADKSTIKAIGEFINKLPEVTKDALYSGLVALPLGALGAGVGTVASRTVPALEPSPMEKVGENLSGLLKDRRQIFDEIRESLATGKTPAGEEFSVDDVFKLRRDPAIQKLGLVDQLNDLIIEHWAGRLDLGPTAEAAASRRSGGMVISETEPLREEKTPRTPLGETPPAGAPTRPTRAGAESETGAQFANKLLALRRKKELESQGIAAEVVPVKGGYAVWRIEEKPAEETPRPGPTVVAKSAEESARAFEEHFKAEEERLQKEAEKAKTEEAKKAAKERMRAYLDRALAQHPAGMKLLKERLAREEAEGLGKEAGAQEAVRASEEAVAAPQPEVPVTPAVAQPVPSEEQQVPKPEAAPAPVAEGAAAVSELKAWKPPQPGAYATLPAFSEQEAKQIVKNPMEYHATLVEEAKERLSVPGYERVAKQIEKPKVEFLGLMPPRDHYRQTGLNNSIPVFIATLDDGKRVPFRLRPDESLEDAAARAQKSGDQDPLYNAMQGFEDDVKETRSVQRWKALQEEIKAKGLNASLVEEQEDGTIVVSDDENDREVKVAPGQTVEQALAEAPAPEATEEPKPEGKETLPEEAKISGLGATPDELIAEFERQVEEAKKTPKIKREIEIKKQMKEKKKAVRDALTDMRRIAKEISEIIGGERGSVSFEEVDPAKWEKVRDKLWEMYDKAVEAGMAMKEFVSLAVHLLGEKGLPYFKKFAKEELPGGRKREEAKPVAPGGEEGEGIIRVGEEGKPKEEKKPKGTKVEKLIDAGEKMAGKRSSKDPRENAEAIRLMIDERTQGRNTLDWVGEVLSIVGKRKTFKPQFAEVASPGLKRYAEFVSATVPTFTEIAARMAGAYRMSKTRWSAPFLDLIATKLQSEEISPKYGGRKYKDWFLEGAAEYQAAIERLSDIFSKAVSVEEAFQSLKENLLSDKEKHAPSGRFQTLLSGNAEQIEAELTDYGKLLYKALTGRVYRLFRSFDSYDSFVEKEQVEIVGPQPIERVSTPLMQITTPAKYRDGKNVAGDDLIKTYGLRGVEFGEWTEATHRQQSVNLAYDSLAMLAEAIGAPQRGIGLGAGTAFQLGLAFGSRGHGKAAAHYEPGNHVINLTKTRGDGSLAHEWGHALHYMGSRTITLENNTNYKYRSYSPFDDLMEALKAREDIDSVERDVDQILRGLWGHASQADRIEAAKNLLQYPGRYKSKTAFFKNALALDKNVEGKYWSKKEEMFARAFEAWVSRKLDADNAYLVDKAFVSPGFVKEHFNQPDAYPSQEESEYFDGLFDRFFSSIEWGEDGVPRLSADYVPVTVQIDIEVREAMKRIEEKLDSILRAIYQGKPSQNDLYWYAYTVSTRGEAMQPPNYEAFDDDYRREGQREDSEIKGAVGYASPLKTEQVISYGLIPVKLEGRTTIVTVEVKDGDLRDWRESFAGEVEGEVSDEGKKPGGGVVAPVGDGNLGQGGGRPGGPDIAPGGESTVRGGTGHAPIGPNVRGSLDAEGEKALKDVQKAQRKDYTIKQGDIDQGRSLAKRFQDNLAAIRILRKLEAENRLATEEEQAILVKFSGWGGLGPALAHYPTEQWRNRSEVLRNILTPDELSSARESSLTAYYTPPEVISQMWDMVQRLGFRGGRVLEPAAGSGHIIGMMPEPMRDLSSVVGVELDPVTAKIAAQLYQTRTILNSPFEEAAMPLEYYDLVVGNVPFHEIGPYDPLHNPGGKLNLHNYFINKSLDLLKPGGLLVTLTSTYTMDTQDTSAREMFSRKADLVAAIRLPNGIFADAEAGADLLIFRKKGTDLPELPATPDWIQTRTERLPYVYESGTLHTEITGKAEARINNYFFEKSTHVLGKIGFNPGQNRTITIGSLDNIGEQLERIAETLPAGIFMKDREMDFDPLAGIVKEGEIRDGAYFIRDGKVYVNESGAPVLYKDAGGRTGKEAEARVKGMVQIRDQVHKLLRLQGERQPEVTISAERAQLRKLYDAFVKKYGPLNNVKNVRLFAKDPDAYLLLGLEEYDEVTGKVESLAAIFTENTLAPSPPTTAKDADEALLISLGWRGRVDLAYMSQLAGMDQNRLVQALGDKIFDDPQRGWITKEEYLSGDVAAKLQVAEAAAKLDPAFERNVKALQAVLPDPLPPEEIRWQLGASYLSPETIVAFIEDLIPGAQNVRVTRCEALGSWSIDFTSGYTRRNANYYRDMARNSYESTHVWGVVGESGGRLDFFDLLDAILNGKTPVVREPSTGAGTRPAIDRAATELAIQRMQRIREEFRAWLLKSKNTQIARGEAERYNKRFRTFVAAQWNGEHLAFPGKVPNELISLRPHQKAAVYRYLRSGRLYLAHEVGTGKTYTMIAAIMESKRLRLHKRAVMVVEKKTVPDIRAAFSRLYPGARVLYLEVPGDKAKRKQALGRLATDQYDAVVLTRESFAKIPLSPEMRAEFVRNEAEKLESYLTQAKNSGVRGGKQLRLVEKALLRLRAQLQRYLDMERDDVPTFDKLGIDMLVVDEAHAYKNLAFFTNLKNVKGINPTGSHRSMDLFAKTQYLLGRYGRGVLFASGTPLTNSVGELYTISRYLQYPELENRGLTAFDAWANTFGTIARETEPAIEGGGYREATRFQRFINLPELMDLTRQVLDIVKFDDVVALGKKLKRPEIKGGKPIAVTVPPNPAVKAYQEILKQRAMAVRLNPLEAKYNDKPDNILVIATHARLMAMDPRLLFPDEHDYKDTKTNYAVKKILEIYKEKRPAIDWSTGEDYEEAKHVQLVFSDRGTPKGSGFSVYHDLRDKLIAGGIPAEQIAIVHEYTKEDEVKRLHRRINNGQVRVVIGSTPLLGIGLNIQQRVSAIHHLDVDWNYSNYAQRNGRGWRWGNRIKEIEIYNYGTEGTIDAFMWDKIAMKERVLSQVLSTGAVPREVEDISQEAIQAEEMVALLANDPLAKEKIDLEARVRQLDNEYQWFLRKRAQAKRRLDHEIDADIETAKRKIEFGGESLDILDKIKAVRIPDKFLGHDVAAGTKSKLRDFYSIEKHGPEINKIVRDLVKLFKAGTKLEHKFGEVGQIVTEKVSYLEEEPYVETVEGKEIKKTRQVEKQKEVQKFVPLEGQTASLYLKIDPSDKTYEVILKTNANSGFVAQITDTFSLASNINYYRESVQKRIAEAQEAIQSLERERSALQQEMAKTFDLDELSQAKARLQQVTEELVRRQAEAERQWRSERGNTVEVRDGRLIYDIDVSEFIVKPTEEELAASRADMDPSDTVIEILNEEERGKGEAEPMAEETSGPRPVAEMLSLDEAKQFFKGQKVFRTSAGSIVVQTKNGDYVEIRTVEKISSSNVSFEIAYGKKFDKTTTIISGTYKAGTIRLSKQAKSHPIIVLGHEVTHWLEDIGLLNDLEVAALRNEIRKLHREGKYKTLNPKAIGGSEDRANYIAQKLFERRFPEGIIGRILTKISDWADRLLTALTRQPTARSVVRKIESGEIFERKVTTQKFLRAGGFQLMTEEQTKLTERLAALRTNPFDAVRKPIEPKEESQPPDHLKVATARIQADAEAFLVTMARTLKSYLPSNLPTGSFLEQLLRTAEWWDHEVLRGVFRAAHARTDRVVEIFREIDEGTVALGTETNSVTEATNQLKTKGLTRKEILMGKTSKEYKQLMDMLEYGDTQFNKGTMTPEEAMDAQEEYWRKKGVSDQVIAVWKAHRAAYDRALELQMAPFNELLDMLKEKEAHRIAMELAPENLKAVLKKAKRGKAIEVAMSQFPPKLKQKLQARLEAVDIKEFVTGQGRSLTLKQVLAEMGKLKGTYAPRIRAGGWVVKGTKGKNEIRYHETNRFAAERTRLRLQREGWEVDAVQEVRRLPEEVYEHIKVMDTQALIDRAAAGLEKKDPDLFLAFRKDLLEEVAREIMARGYRSHRIRRRPGPVVKGYIEDPLERYVRYTSNISAGIAKSEAAYQMIVTLNGSWDENGKRIGGIDPAKEPRAYQMAQRYIAEQLRNSDGVDRFIGMAKAIATLKYLGLPNVRAPFVNLTAMATTVPASIHEYVGGGKVPFTRVVKEVAVALRDYGRWMTKKKRTGLTNDEMALLDAIQRRQWDNPQYIQDASGAIQGALGRRFRMAVDGALFLFSKTEQLNRGATMLAAYRVARRLGADHASAAYKARECMEKAHGIYGRATLPAIAQGTNPLARVSQAYYVYMKFGHNYSQMLYDLGLKKKNYRAFAWALSSQAVIGGAMSTPFAVIGWTILKAILAPFTDRDPEKWWWDQVRDNLGPYGEQTVRYGLVGAAGADISGSLAFDPAVPKNLRELTGALGGVAGDIADAYHYWMTGQPVRVAETVLPVGVANIFRAIRELNGAVTKTGNRVWDENGYPYLPGTGATVLRLLGFRSAERAMLQERQWEAKRQASAFSERRNDLYEEYRAYLSGQDVALDELWDAIARYNEEVVQGGYTNYVPVITKQSLRRQLLDMARPTKRELAIAQE